MILFLRGLFLVILGSMLAITCWAGSRCPLAAVPEPVASHPWFVATLFEAYWGFVTFFVWVCYKQTSWLARAAWLGAILLLGNIAVASYCLTELFSVPRTAPVAEVLSARRSGPGWIGLVLATAGIALIGCSVS